MNGNESLSDATRYEIAQHARNRVALALVVAFIPVWLTLVHVIIPAGEVSFYHNVTGRAVTLDANRLSMVSGAMNAVTLIVGFMMFSAVRRSSDFDRRLVLAGYTRSALLLAKLIALALAAAVVSLYATVVLVLFWAPDLVVQFYLSLTLSGLTYGGIGILLGVLFRTELAGMFLIIMISLVDVMVQNPIIAPSSRSGAVTLLPTYGAMQNAVGAAFTGDLSVGYFLLGLLWLAGAAVIGLVVFHRRTRDHIARVDSAMSRPQQDRSATVVVSLTPEGRLRIHSATGPVVVHDCPHDLGPQPDPPQEPAVVPVSRLALEFIEPGSPVGLANTPATAGDRR
ncbi:ABC transporter permease [Actinophytocola glycyrrhizae]|uniref:ABC transporter permease n=1 Tax=Actinophytocola glycyrrhizae TaxID=2044873 RepID=A0ABV9RTT1_9PSEU